MSLSRRLYEAQRRKDRPTVDEWNKRLKREIRAKQAKRTPPAKSAGRPER